jgi:hypothetical protein
VDDFNVRRLIPAANIVAFANLAVLKDRPDGIAVVFNVEPISNLHAIAIDRQRFARECVEDHQGDKFFRELVWPVVV